MAAIQMTINDDGTIKKDYVPLFPWAEVDEP